MFKRQIFTELLKRTNEKRKFIQVLSGPRQTGKTTLAKQLIDAVKIPSYYCSADEQVLDEGIWISQQWEVARLKLKSSEKKVLLIIDEVQKIYNWSETVKKLWDEDSVNRMNINVILLGSSKLLMQKGLTESLAGRFEIIPVTHWSYAEMKKAFGYNIDEYIFYGGYPGGTELINDQNRWVHYIAESIIETTVSNDILMLTRVNKPALLKRLFELGCLYSARILSYQKILRQLQDAGNTTTLAHYLNLLDSAGLLTGLPKYSQEKVRQRSSTPKLLVLNTALMSSCYRKSFKEIRSDGNLWGHFVESTVGASLSNGIKGKDIGLYYWAGFNREVDFILSKGDKLIAMEVKSGRKKSNLPGMDIFSKHFKVYKKILVGEGGISLNDFLLIPPEKWFD